MSDFPEKWYIEITDENRAIVNSWKIKQYYSDDLFKNLQYKYVTSEGGGRKGTGGWWVDYEEITIAQFQEYVLKETPVKIEEDYSYLTPLLEKWNIK